MSADDGSGAGVDERADGGRREQDRVEGGRVRRRKVGKILDVRRERISLAVQAFLP